MQYILKRYHFNTPDEFLLEDLRKTARMLGKTTVSAAVYNAEGTYHSKTLSARFGSWNEALFKAGLEIFKKYRAAKEPLLENLKRVWNALGRQPHLREMKRPLSEFSHGAYTNQFGSWRAALEVFAKAQGIYPPAPKTGAVCDMNKNTAKKAPARKYISKSMRFDIMKRDNFKCRLCGRSPATHPGLTLEIDHIVPLSKNGTNDPENQWTLCNECNMGKGAKSMSTTD